MKNRLWTIPFLFLLATVAAEAEGMKCGAGKCGSGVQERGAKSALLHEVKERDGYRIVLTSLKPLVSGNNRIAVTVTKEGKAVEDLKVKVKFFMPEMPGMPYMEYKTKLQKKNGSYQGMVNFSMNGTWQYQLKFKDSNGKVHSVRGSVNL